MEEWQHRTVADSIVLFLNHRRARNLSPDTVEKYERMLRRILSPMMGRNCASVTTEDVERRIYGLEGLRPETVNGYVASLKCWANYCRHHHIAIGVSPKGLKKVRTEKRLPPHLAENEIISLLAAPDRLSPYGCRDHCLMALLLDTGLRITAAVSIRLDDIRTDRIRVIDKGPMEREVAISQNMQQILANWIGVRQVYLGEAFPGDTDYLFPGRRRRRLSNRQAEDIVRRHASAAGIGKRVYPHMLRSTFATEAVRSGIGMEHLRKAMGWTTLAMAKAYVEAFDVDAQAEARRHSPIGRLEVRRNGARLRKDAI